MQIESSSPKKKKKKVEVNSGMIFCTGKYKQTTYTNWKETLRSLGKKLLKKDHSLV